MVAASENAVLACFGFEPLWQKSSQIVEGHTDTNRLSIAAGLVAKVGQR
jgi:hypothetical protein